MSTSVKPCPRPRRARRRGAHAPATAPAFAAAAAARRRGGGCNGRDVALGLAAALCAAAEQGLTLVHYSAQFEPILTQKSTP
jgi:hypothetical protein